MNKKAKSKNPFNPKAPFKWVFMDIIPETEPLFLTSETTFLIIFSLLMHTKPPKIHGMYRIITEEVMDKLDMFQSRFGKIDKFGYWDLEIIPAGAGTQFSSMEFQDEC